MKLFNVMYSHSKTVHELGFAFAHEVPNIFIIRINFVMTLFLAYFRKIGLYDLHPARQRGLLCDEGRDRPFSVGALT
jgi:hypothetical protein